jgi:hypothetical protein
MVKKGQLTAKQADFVLFYTTLGADTYNNAMQSALKAGYNEITADQACQSILGSDRVKKAIGVNRAINRANSLDNVQDIRDMHKMLFDKAVETSDLALARLNLQDLGRTYAAYTDKAVIDNEFTLNIQRFTKVIESNVAENAPELPEDGQTPIVALTTNQEIKQATIEGETDAM